MGSQAYISDKALMPVLQLLQVSIPKQPNCEKGCAPPSNKKKNHPGYFGEAHPSSQLGCFGLRFAIASPKAILWSVLVLLLLVFFLTLQRPFYLHVTTKYMSIEVIYIILYHSNRVNCFEKLNSLHVTCNIAQLCTG